MMTERTNRGSAILIVVAVLALLGAGIWQLIDTGRSAHERISQGLDSATRAEVTIAAGLGRVQIGTLDQPGALVAGDIIHDDRGRLERSFALRGDTATYAIRERWDTGAKLITRGGDELRWDLRLSRQVPLRLTIETGVGESVLDLADLQLTHLDLHTGVGNTSLTLPRQGQLLANVSGGVGNLTVAVPRGTAVWVDVGSRLGAQSVLGDYLRQGDVYISPNYETAQNRVELHASSGIGTITIQPALE